MAAGIREAGWESTVIPGFPMFLQAGVKQSVDSSGNPSYAAWFQWYTPNFLNTLSETSPLAPAIAAGGNAYIASKGDGNDNINIMGSPGNGSNFENKFTPGNTSQAPVLCNHINQLFYRVDRKR